MKEECIRLKSILKNYSGAEVAKAFGGGTEAINRLMKQKETTATCFNNELFEAFGHTFHQEHPDLGTCYKSMNQVALKQISRSYSISTAESARILYR